MLMEASQLGVVDALAPARWWVVGFEHGPYEPVELRRDAHERGMTATIDLVGPGDPGDRRRQFELFLRFADALAHPRKIAKLHDQSLIKCRTPA